MVGQLAALFFVLIVAWESAKHLVNGPQVKEEEAGASGTNTVPSGLEPAA